ncbi:hypothetical protein AAES_01761 [Amazona aestiva]|uniref:Uncharacterized protein n=1 Tax=Amazona aestiva TaxID=12930 RepID=A0A0Q3U5Q9_AMAAE|nr:hypothetical protein AAES_01761 [Amazona aestiva]
MYSEVKPRSVYLLDIREFDVQGIYRNPPIMIIDHKLYCILLRLKAFVVSTLALLKDAREYSQTDFEMLTISLTLEKTKPYEKVNGTEIEYEFEEITLEREQISRVSKMPKGNSAKGIAGWTVQSLLSITKLPETQLAYQEMTARMQSACVERLIFTLT